MRKGNPVGGYVSPYAKPDTSVVSGLTVEVSPETRRARARSEYGARTNTNANRKNGGGATVGKLTPESLAGAQRVTPPTTSGVRTKDDWGSSLPIQHMTATRKPNRDNPVKKQTQLEGQLEYCRQIERARIERRDLAEYK